MPFWVLEIPSPGVITAKDAWCFWVSHSGVVLPFIRSQILLASSTVSCWDPPVTPEIQMDSAPMYLDAIRVHCVLEPAKALYSCGSDMSGPWTHEV